VKFSKSALTLLVAGLFAATTAQAATYDFNYEALAANEFKAVSGDFGANLQVGDTVNFTLRTLPGQAFTAVSGNYMWAILGVDNVGGGSRQATYTWGFYNNGTLVGSGSNSENTCCIHLGPDATTNFNGLFNAYSWSGEITGLVGSTNLAADIGFEAAPLPLYGGTWSYGYTTASLTSVVPEPASLALMMAGLGVVGASLRRRQRA
jgi:hypothetical protein